MPKQLVFDVANSFKATLFVFMQKCKPFMFTIVLLEERSTKVQLLNFKDKTYNLSLTGQFPVQIYELLYLRRFLQLAVKAPDISAARHRAAHLRTWGVLLLSKLSLTPLHLRQPPPGFSLLSLCYRARTAFYSSPLLVGHTTNYTQCTAL